VDYPDTFDTPRVHLRPLQVEDAPQLYEAVMRHPAAARFLTWQPATSLEDAAARVEQILDEQRNGTSMTWVMVGPQRPRQALGMFTVWSTEHGQELGYCLTPDAWGKGLMTETVRAVTARLLADAEVWRVWATCDLANTGSIAVLEKAGFRREGLLRRSAIHPNLGPHPRDCLLYAAVTDDERTHTTLNPPTVFDSLQYGFSQAVELPAGRRLLLSGQVAADEHGTTRHHDLDGQTRHCLDNIDRLLAAAGAQPTNIAFLRIYLTEAARDQMGTIAQMLRERFPTQPPASTWLVVAGLARPDWLIEIEAEAAL
jgi:2-iminobutanoate/2-iminopropanoate deaminase